MNEKQNKVTCPSCGEYHMYMYGVDGISICHIPTELIAELHQFICVECVGPVKFYFGGVDGIGG